MTMETIEEAPCAMLCFYCHPFPSRHGASFPPPWGMTPPPLWA